MDNFTKAVLTEADKQIDKGNPEWIVNAINDLAYMSSEVGKAVSETDAYAKLYEKVRYQNIAKRLYDKLR